MSKNPVTINEMISQMLSEARRLGYSEATIWRNLFPGLDPLPSIMVRRESLSMTLKLRKNTFPSKKNGSAAERAPFIITKGSSLRRTV